MTETVPSRVPRMGVMEGVLRQPRSRLFPVAAELGFDGVEMEVREDAESLADAARESGVAICSLICDGTGFGSRDPEARHSARARLARAAANAASLGAEVILLPQFDLKELADGAAVARFVNDLKDALPAVVRAGVTVGWENALSAADTLRVLDRIGSPALACYFDFANAAKRGADPAEELRQLGGRVCRVHAKNLNKQPLDAPGVDLQACLRVLRKQDYSGWIVLETAPGEDPLAAARHNRRVLLDAWSRL